jgi:hypothetical protein
MRWGTPELLSDAQVDRIKDRQKELALTNEQLMERFKAALKASPKGIHSDKAAQMRLDRIFYSRMRCPISETTKLALARALDWTLLDFQNAIAMENGARKMRSGNGAKKM